MGLFEDVTHGVCYDYFKEGNLLPLCISPYRIYKRIVKVASEYELPPKLATANPMFHISMLKKLMGNPSFIIPKEYVRVKDDNLIRRYLLIYLINMFARSEHDVAPVKVL